MKIKTPQWKRIAFDASYLTVCIHMISVLQYETQSNLPNAKASILNSQKATRNNHRDSDTWKSLFLEELTSLKIIFVTLQGSFKISSPRKAFLYFNSFQELTIYFTPQKFSHCSTVFKTSPISHFFLKNIDNQCYSHNVLLKQGYLPYFVGKIVRIIQVT